MEEEGTDANGSLDRVHEAWHVHHERLWRAVLAWGGDREVASDAVAEAFVQAIKRDGAIADVGAWVWRSAFRIAAGMLQERRRGATAPADRSNCVDRSGLPDDVVVLIDLLDRLPTADRTVVVLSLVGGWPAADVARFTDSSAGAVRVRLHRARARLRTMLEESGG